MSSLNQTVRNIQRAVGTVPDGIFGPLTAAAVLRELNAQAGIETEDQETVAELARAASEPWRSGLDPRTMLCIEGLDPAARGRFAQFARLAKATAATMGCDYILIGGHRSWAEQDALYAQGRSTSGRKVTNAIGGASNHNFGIAGDFGVFRNGDYLDNANPTLAAKVHRACSEHAESCGLEWGGSWESFKDLPHYEIWTGLSMAQKRAKYKAEGSVL